MFNLSFLPLFEITCSDTKVYSTSVCLITPFPFTLLLHPICTSYNQKPAGWARTNIRNCCVYAQVAQEPINSQIPIPDLLMTCYMALNHWVWDFLRVKWRSILCKERDSLRTSRLNNIKIPLGYFSEIW